VKAKADPCAPGPFELPVLEDANAVQLAVKDVLERLERGLMAPKTAGLMLYGLQTASANLKNTEFGAQRPADLEIG
jgi:hypothetical protein